MEGLPHCYSQLMALRGVDITPTTQLTFTYSKSAVETLGKGVKYV